MGQAVRQTLWEDDKYTAHDYVQDGLISMWDGIENGGWGIHAENATEWVDLKGNNNLLAKNTPIVNRNSFSFDGNCCFYKYNLSINSVATVEVCGSRAVQQLPRTDPELLRMNGSNGGYKLYCNREKVMNGIFGIGGLPHMGMDNSRTSAWIINAYPQRQYLDAVYIGSWDMDRPLNNVSSVIIGADGTGLGRGCICTIHCVRLYSRVLSQHEIVSNYFIDNRRFNLR